MKMGDLERLNPPILLYGNTLVPEILLFFYFVLDFFHFHMFLSMFFCAFFCYTEKTKKYIRKMKNTGGLL